MFEELKKSIDKGLDFAFMNAEKLAQAAKEMAKENKLNKEEAKKLYDYLLQKSEDARQTVENDLQEMVIRTLKKMNVAMLEDLKKLDDRVKKLEAAAKPAPKAKAAPKVVKSTKVKVKK